MILLLLNQIPFRILLRGKLKRAFVIIRNHRHLFPDSHSSNSAKNIHKKTPFPRTDSSPVKPPANNPQSPRFSPNPSPSRAPGLVPGPPSSSTAAHRAASPKYDPLSQISRRRRNWPHKLLTKISSHPRKEFATSQRKNYVTATRKERVKARRSMCLAPIRAILPIPCFWLIWSPRSNLKCRTKRK